MTTDRCTKDTIEDQVYNKLKNWNRGQSCFIKFMKKNKVIQAMKTQTASRVLLLQPAASYRLYNVHKL